MKNQISGAKVIPFFSSSKFFLKKTFAALPNCLLFNI
jgi:hypothetical protein